ncbi:MAG: hydantoinase B/oxoprolinase family protein [Anaerolineae bacterium]
MTHKADPITMQVVRYALEQVAEEMGRTLVRTSRSTIIKEIVDISCAVFDRQGNTVAQAHHAPMLLTGFEIPSRELLKHYRPEALEEGDIIILNDPYQGGQHVMDVIVFAPVRLDGELIGFVGSMAHHADMGGAVPGGVAGGLTEIYLEGLRFSFTKLYKRGQEDSEIFGILENNIRVPDKTLGDLRAQVSASFVGAQRLRRIHHKFGPAVTQDCMAMLLDYSERRIRAGLESIADGVYTGVDFVDDDGHGDAPIRVQVNLRKEGDSARVDFAGTDAEVPGNVNCPLATTHAATYYALIALIDPHVPPNSGCYRPIHIEAEPGLVVNPRLPRAVGSRTNTSAKICEAMLRALTEALPKRGMAGSHGQVTTCALAGYHPRTGRRYVYIDIQGGGAGARPTKDGRDGQDSHLARFKNTPIEAAELEFPIRVERYEFIPDSGGAGKFRGALALRRDVRLLAGEVSFARYSDRHKFAPQGIFEGRPGAKGRIVLNPGSASERRLKSKGQDILAEGDLISLQSPGAGGYGSPLERDPQQVWRDVRDEKVTPQAARREYGVIIDPETGALDEAATRRERARRTASDEKPSPPSLARLPFSQFWERGSGGEGIFKEVTALENAILNELTFETGHLNYKGVRYMFIRPEVIATWQKGLEAEVGPEKCAEIMMAAGGVGGAKSSQRYKEVFNYTEQEIVEFMCKMGGEIGWGIFRLAHLDLDAGQMIVEVRDSPFAAAYGPSETSVCHLIRGVMGGMGAGIFGPQAEVSSQETACAAKGDPACRFEVSKL